MKHKITAMLLAFVLCLGLAAPALARDGDFEIEDGVLTHYRGSDDHVVIPDGVTGIALNVFSSAGCNEMTSITIPSSVTDIEERAFWNCRNLTAIHVDGENPSYCDVDGVLLSRDMALLHTYPKAKPDSAYTVPDGVTMIGDDAFRECSSLTAVTIPDGVTVIGMYAFYGCEALTDVTVPASVTVIDAYAFCATPWQTSMGDFPVVNGFLLAYQGTGGDVVIPDGVTTITEEAFSYLDEVTAVTIPGSVTAIGECAFYECNSLTEITLPNSVTAIGPGAFSGCDSLTAVHVEAGNPNYYAVDGVLFSRDGTLLHTHPAGRPEASYTIPDGVTRIEAWAFDDCVGLTAVVLPNSFTSIGREAFIGCTGLTEVTIPDSVTEFGYGVFKRCENLASVTLPSGLTYIAHGMFGSCDGLKSFVVPNSVTTIEGYAFAFCKNLSNVTIPDSVTEIGRSAFLACDSLSEITIPGSVVTISEDLFFGCDNLTDVTLLPGVTSLKKYAFLGCAKLKSITIPASVTSIGESVFDGGTRLTDIYYGGTEEQWKAINFGKYNFGLGSATIHYNSVPEPTPTPDPSPAPSTPTGPSVSASSTPAPVEVKRFSDVNDGDYFAKAVEWAAGKHIAAGTTDTTFSPNAACTTAQILTFLWRAEGSPAPAVENPFSTWMAATIIMKPRCGPMNRDLLRAVASMVTRPAPAVRR